PLLALVAVGFWWDPGTSREARIGWWTSLPFAAFFLIASLGGPPEAHWMAPAWIGVGLGVAQAEGRALRRAWFAVGTGLFASGVLVLHAQIGVFRLPLDPADR